MRHTISSFRHSLFTLCSHPVHLRRPRYLRMNVSGFIALALLLVPTLASAQPFDIAQGGPAARQISFADVAASVVQSNFQLRAASLNVAIAQAQLAQAQGGQMPQATLSGSYTRTQELRPAFPLDPDIYAAGVAISYPLSTGGRVEAQIALAQANLRGARAAFNRTKQQLIYSAEQIYLQGLLDRPDPVALQSQIGVAQAGIDLARSGGRPAVFLGAGYEFSNFSGQSPYVFGSWLATLSVTLSVFDGGITQAKVSEAQLQLEQLKIREAQTRQQIELDVRLAW